VSTHFSDQTRDYQSKDGIAQMLQPVGEGKVNLHQVRDSVEPRKRDENQSRFVIRGWIIRVVFEDVRWTSEEAPVREHLQSSFPREYLRQRGEAIRAQARTQGHRTCVGCEQAIEGGRSVRREAVEGKHRYDDSATWKGSIAWSYKLPRSFYSCCSPTISASS